MAYAKINSITNANMAKVNNAAKAALGKIANIDAPSSYSNTKSINFDGSNDHISIGNIDWDADFSMVIWFKTTTTSFRYLWAKDAGNYIALRLLGDPAWHYQGSAVGASADNFTNTSLFDGNWHMLAYTITGGSGSLSTAKLYMDGSLEDTISSTQTYTNRTDDGTFGCRTHDGGTAYNFHLGNMDEIGVWKDTVLDADAITDLYNSGTPIDLSSDSGNYDNSGDLSHWWRMGDGDTYPTITDNEGSLDGTMTNMVSGDIETDVPS